MEQWKIFLKKQVKCIYEDGQNHYSKKVGLVLAVTPSHMLLAIDGRTEAILLTKILRVEVKNGNP